MLKTKWCCILLSVLLVAGLLFTCRWYFRYRFSPIEGHTEVTKGQPGSDDYNHCFVSDNKLDVVLNLSLPELKHAKVDAFLMDLNSAGKATSSSDSLSIKIENPNPTPDSLKDGRAEIRFSDRARPLHLGPGPYMAEVIVTPMDAANIDGTPRRFFYYYQTYDPKKGPQNCAEYHQ